MSPNENISDLNRTKIKNISHVHLPTPLIIVSFSKTSSLVKFLNSYLFFSKKIKTFLMYSTFLNDSPID
ncbi:MAG: hypothetical protein CMD10_03725 [Flavobacteriales bacterium]|nr:hypothetical protein [Flavobacteriales bacterium]